MPQRTQFFADLEGESRQAALLVVQVGAMPTELQVITQIAEFDESVEGLRPIRSYIIRVNGVLEHRVVNLGMTVNDVQLTFEHPVLAQYTEDPAALFFRGQPRDVHELTLDIAQAHATTFGQWRQFPEYLNHSQPLTTLLQSGGGLLGQMPLSLANRLVKVLEHHGLETKLTLGEAHVKQAQGPLKQQQLGALLFGDSYFISYMFTIEEMRPRKASR